MSLTYGSPFRSDSIEKLKYFLEFQRASCTGTIINFLNHSFAIAGPRYRRPKKPKDKTVPTPSEDKRPRTAFSNEQLARLKVTIERKHYIF